MLGLELVVGIVAFVIFFWILAETHGDWNWIEFLYLFCGLCALPFALRYLGKLIIFGFTGHWY